MRSRPETCPVPGETLSRQLGYWRRKLAGAPAGLDLPTDFPRPAVRMFRSASHTADLPASLAAGLRAFCRSEGATLFMVLLAALDVLLARYSGQEDLLVGWSVSTGLIVNLLALRADLKAVSSFRELLGQVRATVLGAREHQDVPFETLVAELLPEHDRSRSPFFQVLLAEERGVESAGLDLSLAVVDGVDSDAAPRISVEYNADLFAAATVHRLAGHLGRLLEEAVRDPERGWRDLPLLTEAESEQLLDGFNDTGSTSGPEVCLHQLFEAQAAQNPDRMALVAPDGRLTYGELNRRANRLAARLRALGLGPESLAGVLMDRTADLVVALLAVLKAGGAYAPLDPNYPRQRVLLMLETSRAKVLVTRRSLAEGLPNGIPAVFLDEGWEEGSDGSDRSDRSLRSVLPDNLAYVIFTSGSTGTPKGVAIQHRNAVAMVRWARTVYSPGEYAGVLASTSICFDMSVFEIFATLAEGGKVILAENALALPRLEAKDEVVLVDTVPSAMAELLRTGGLPPSIRTVNLGGEPLKGSLVREIYDKLPGVERVVNLYGPSEDTTFSTWSVVPRDAGHPLIGRPLTGESAYVLDASLRPVPLGIPGALYLGGEGVTRGYLHRPDLTAERYVPNPYGPPGSRLYRVGDLARYLPSGELDFLGRLDHQVKVRGFRIELGEIESALTRHPEVREAAVLATPDPLGGNRGNRLIAWVESERDIPPGELRELLRISLPDYMVPSAFAPLRQMPLTPNGKIDRRALAVLAAMPLPSASETQDGRAPGSQAEEILAGIWSEVFGRRVGVSESFFDLGGDSLMAARVLARVRAELGTDLPPSAVLEAFTVAALAERVEQALAGGAPVLSLLPVTPRPRDGRGEPLSLVQRRLWFLERLVPGTPASNIPIVIRLDGLLAPAVLERSVAEIAARHEALRTTIEIGRDGEPRQWVAPPAPFLLPLVDLSGLPLQRRSEERGRLAREEARRPLDLRGALWRRLLLRAGEREHDLLVNFHHVIADGESVHVFERELAALYSTFLRGWPSPLPALPVQPADVAAWECEQLTPEVLAPHLAWFREHLAGAPAGLDLPADLPADRPRPPVRSWRGVSHAVALPPALLRDVRELARRRGATAYMVLFASWVAFLRRITGQDDVVVGTVLAHRNRPEVEGLIGFFANSLPLRVERPGDPAFAGLLSQVRTGALSLQVHQDLSLEYLAEVLRPGRASSAEPLFQAFFALHGNAGRRELAPGLAVSWREEDHGAAQFDFLLDLEDRGEEIAGRIMANADLFTRPAVERLARGWMALLAGTVARPDAPISTLALLGEAERHLLAEWSRTPFPPAWNGSVPARIMAWADATPGAVAVLPAEPGLPALTYGELVDRARRLAGSLRVRGVGPGVLVGVYAERSPETLVGMLAVLLAGGAFLPLDPAYPADRLAFILEDSRVELLLAGPALAAALPAGGATVVPLDSSAGGWPEIFEDAGPGDLAYVIYTSGSTGRPKGVLIPHGGFLGAVEALAERSGVVSGSRVLQFAAAGFDASVWEIWSTLIRGATLAFARPEDLLPGPPLLAILRDRGITNVFLTPTALAALPPGAERELSGLRGLVVGGEAFPPDLVARWAPGRRLWNAYGPTEASICVTMARLGEDGQTPIGRPVAGSRLLVLGRHQEILPPGIPGELWLGGPGLAYGYLGRPDLTAGAFLPDPFSGEAGARLYRTGDLVRFRPDGQLEFLGRADRQVKIRGFRIEPGEIEAQIAGHPGVREAVVEPYQAGPGDLRLAAYVVGTDSSAPSAHELRAFLRGRLPEPMVPSSFTFLPALPLSPGGKIDRRALPPPVPEEPTGTAGGPAAPRTPVEDRLAGIWSEVLGRAGIGAGDDFFDLGGHSLLIGQVLARVHAAFGVELPVRTAFEARTLADLARRIEGALGELLTETSEDPSSRTSLVRVSRAPGEETQPLSFGQQRLWFLDRLKPGSTVYNLPAPFHIAGPLDADALERSLNEVFRRHEVLRTTFGEGPDGEPYQVVASFHPFALPRVDLTALPPAVAHAEARRQGELEARRPFDLVQGPVARALLLRLGAEEHHLLFVCHHIAFDGWSVIVLQGELSSLYGAFAAGRPSPLEEPAIQYGDFALWQREDAALEGLLARWTGHLAGAPTALDLPADRPRPATLGEGGGLRSVPLPAALARAVRDLGRSEGATPFMVLLAALAALLGRLTGQRDFLIGTPAANRNRAELEELIGFFVNTLVLRCDLAGGDREGLSFRGLLARLREESLAAYGVQDLPFEKLVERLQPQRDPSRNPLFQILFVFQSAPGQDVPEPDGLALEPFEIGTGTSKFDLTVEVFSAGRDLRLQLEYATDLFDPATAERLADGYLLLLEDAMARLGAPLGDLALLSPAESQQLLREWNDTGTDYGPDYGPDYGSPGCLHQLIEAQVDRTPGAVAVAFAGRSLTYAELDRRANLLAHRLLGLGVRPESPVGVCVERSLELMVALLAILKAGAAYVPLDPEYPRERLAFMVEDALGGLAAPVLLAQERLLPVLPETSVRTVLVDEVVEGEPSDRPELPVHPDQVAYLIYTSGSTGRPKGVMNSHRGIVNRLLWMQETYRLDAADRVLQKTPASFDVSVWEFFWPLLTGARLVMALPGGHRDPSYLARVIVEEGVTTAHFVPSMLSLFLEAPEAGSCASLRRVVCSGEALPYELQQRFQARLACPLHNLYGPTEAAVDVTFWECRRGGPPVVPIGRPVANTRIHILDAELRPVPIGVAGELHIGGVQLARGYWRRPALTAERFVPDPYGEGRLYRTGDLACHRPDGSVEYLGRLDDQVKVRGVRIELGEIEAVLSEHPEVLEAVVAARAASGGTRLVAWVVPAAGVIPDRRQLRSYLESRLPEPMVPTAWVFLDAMPLTPSGKADRRALPEPEADARSAEAAFVAPRTPVEELVAGIWSQVLGVESVGATDHFFALGGHSLIAARVVSRLRAACGVEIPLRRLFEAPTVAALAEVVEAARRTGTVAAPPIRPIPRAGLLPLSFAQQRLWLLDRLEPGSSVYNLPLACRIDGPLDARCLERSLGEIVRRHEVLRTTFAVVEETGEPHLVIAPSSPFSLSRVDLSGREAEAERLIRDEAERPFDLTAGPLFRAVLFTLGPTDHRLLVTMHHIATDGWSMDVFLGELSALYQGSSLPELPVQYADFAAWQREWLAGPVLEGQLDYWRRQLAGAPEVLDLPADRPRPPVETSRGDSLSIALPPAVASGVRSLARSQGATLFMTLLAGFAAQLHRYTGAADVLLGSPVANRSWAEIEGLLGFFANTLVLRADLSGDPGFDTLLARVREMALAAYAHQDLPFERLVEELQPQRSLAHSPLFQVAFALGVEERACELAPGASLSLLPVESRTSRFDLTLAVDAREGELNATFEYRTDLFDPTTVARWAGHFANLLASVAARPDAPLLEIDLLSPAERHQLAREWNDSGTGAEPVPDLCLHQLFEAQAARTPEAVALVSPDGRQRLSYRELDGRAEALARRLRALGVGPEVLAGVLLDRTVELAVALLAVLKAGGAYVPLDPNYPKSRVLLMLETARATVLVTRRCLAEGLPEGIPRMLLDEGWEDGSDRSDGLDGSVLPDNLAYVIFTSGSTGTPKGVAIEHRSAVAFARWAREAFTPEERAGVLGSTSVCFDISIMEIFVTLAWGGKILLAENVLALPTLPARGEVTMINAVPSAMAELVRSDRLPDSVLVVNTGGEAVSGPLARRIYEQSRAGRVVDVYGPSEDTTYSMTSHIPRDVETPAVGRPIRGTRAYVLDGELGLVPIGVPGAVYLAGDGLARGYLGQPALTAERFIPDPYGEPGARLYRVGDLARWRTDGEMEYLGRIDHQVKLRGFRIELGEIEAVLASHPAVERAVVATHAYGPEDLRLVAWVVPEEGKVIETDVLIAWVAERLPEYMVPSVPSAIMVLEALPLTPNGKVDRFALPVPSLAPSQAVAEPPRSALEELVAGLWSEVLACGRVGLHDDFFELGGYSLLAIRLLARLREATGVDLPLRALFAYPTVAELAAEVERSLRAPGSAALPPIEPVGIVDGAPASSGQERLWFFHQLDPGGAVLNIPQPLRLTGPLQPVALARALTGIARRHASLRTAFSYGEGGLRQRIAPPPAVTVNLPLADLGVLPPPLREEEARRLMAEEAREPFENLAAGPLWRARLLRVGAEEHFLLVTFHHTIADGWSTGLFNRDLAALYQDSSLPEPALQYADYAAWQRRWLTGEALAPQLDYWRRQLAGMPMALDLPADRPRPARPSFRGAARFLPLPPALSAQVKGLGQREGTTLFMTMLAAFAALASRYTGRTDVVLGSPAANRHQPGTEELFGFFAGNLVLRLDLTGDPTFRELLRRSREVALGAYANPDVPFERLVEELDPARDKSRHPLFQVMLSVQTAAGEPFRFAGLAAEPVEMHTATSQLDFTLFANDGPEGLVLAAEYSTDLFEGSTAGRMLQHVATLLAAVVADLDLRISALPAEIAVEIAAQSPTAVQERPMKRPDPQDREARLAERRSKLSMEQKALLEQRLRSRTSQTPQTQASSSLVALQPAGSRPPFFCVHPAGGDVLCFQALSRHMGGDQPFYGVQSRGMGAGEEPLATIEEMAAVYRAEITRAAPGPYHLGGWSLGGAVAYEVARQIAAEGGEVALLAIVDSTPGPWPDPGEPEDEYDDAYWLMEIADYLQRLWGVELGLSYETLRALPSEEQVSRFLAGLKSTPFAAGTAGTGPEPLRRLLRVFKTNVRAFRLYRPGPYPGRITLFRPAEGWQDEAAAADPTLGWGALSPVTIETVPGDHVSALAEPHVRTLAERLRTRIDRKIDRQGDSLTL